MNFTNNESGQVGVIFMIFIALLAVGIFYVSFGSIMNQVQTIDNSVITGGSLPYSQSHYDGMDIIYKYWWGFPIFVVIMLVIYGYKNSISTESGDV